MNKKLKTLTSFLHSGLFYEPYLDVDKIMEGLGGNDSTPLEIMYGETYDAHGLTVDSLKYYLILSLCQKVLEEEGFTTTAKLLIGDTASLRNKLVSNGTTIQEQTSRNTSLIKRIIDTYSLPIETELMSVRLVQPRVKKMVKEMGALFTTDREIQDILPKTVLKNRIAQEKEVNYLYAREEVALILDRDIKIGPPRETHYDLIAQKVALKSKLKQLMGLYVKPTYPLGQHFAFFLTHPEIEEFGITPYKAGSNKLEESRIILNKTSVEELSSLLDSTYVPTSLDAVQPLLDFFIITDLVRKFIEKDFSVPKYSKTDFVKRPKYYLQQALDQYQTYIVKPLQLGE